MTVTSGTEHPARDLLEALASGGVNLTWTPCYAAPPPAP